MLKLLRTHRGSKPPTPTPPGPAAAARLGRHFGMDSRKVTLGLATLSLLVAAPAGTHAHLAWADGTPVPAWVSKSCCGPNDAHHLRADQVRHVEGGYAIDGYPNVIADWRVLPSQDGEYWAFYSETTDTDGQKMFTSMFCFFAPSWG